MMAKKSKPTRREFVLMNKNAPFQYQEAYKSLRTNLNFLVIDCDLRKPVIHRYLKIDNSAYKGITSALADGSLAESIINMKGLGLHVWSRMRFHRTR